MSLNSDALTTVDKVRALLTNVGGGQHTERIEDEINGWSRAIRHYTGRRFLPTEPGGDPEGTLTRLYHYDGQGYLNLEPHEAREITAVSIAIGSETPVAIPTADWRPGPLSKSDEGTYFWLSIASPLVSIPNLPSAPTFRYVVSVTGRWGAGVVPPDVERVCARLVARSFRNPEGYSARRVGPVEYIETDEEDDDEFSLPAGVRKVLTPYRRPRARRGRSRTA